MQTFTATFVKKINAYFSRFYCNETCSSYEVLVVFGQVRVWDRKRAKRVGMVCGAGAGKISQTPAGAGRV